MGEAVRDGHAAVFAKASARDPRPWCGLPALVFGPVDKADDTPDHFGVKAFADELRRCPIELDVAMEDRVEDLIRRQAVVVALAGAELG
jgi:hypothetical protein